MRRQGGGKGVLSLAVVHPAAMSRALSRCAAFLLFFLSLPLLVGWVGWHPLVFVFIFPNGDQTLTISRSSGALVVSVWVNGLDLLLYFTLMNKRCD